MKIPKFLQKPYDFIESHLMPVAFVVGLFLIAGGPEIAYRYSFALCGSLERLFDPDAPPPAEHELPALLVTLLDKFGEALIIAFVVGVAVEKTSRQRFLKETARDALHNILGYDLPDSVKEQLKYILRFPFVRQNFKVLYTFEKQQTVDSVFWRVLSHTEYDVDNQTDTHQQYELNSSIERSRAAATLTNQLLEVEVTGLLHLTAADLAQKAAELEQTVISEQAPYRRVVVPIPIGPHGKLVHVRTTRVAYYRLEDTMVLDILRPPCLGIEVCVKAPPELDVSVAFGVPGDVTHPDRDPRRWFHGGVHLPGAHFRVSWSLQKAGAAPPAKMAVR